MLRFNSINALAIMTLLVLLVIDYFFFITPQVYIILFFSWFIFTGLGSTQITWNYHITSLNRNKTIKENYIAITFDDGPNRTYTPQALHLLKKYNAKATFFCIGRNMETYPELVKQIIDEGHTIGNHTYSHTNLFGFLKTSRVISELKQTNFVAESILGLKLKLYRPAFGITNPNIKRALKVTEHYSIGWSKRSFDTTILSEKRVLKRITSNLKKGDIVLLHDSSEKSIAVLEHLLLFLQLNKMQSITVDQLLAIKPYV